MTNDYLVLTHGLALIGGYALGIYLTILMYRAHTIQSEWKRFVAVMGLFVVMFISCIFMLSYTLCQ